MGIKENMSGVAEALAGVPSQMREQLVILSSCLTKITQANCDYAGAFGNDAVTKLATACSVLAKATEDVDELVGDAFMQADEWEDGEVEGGDTESEAT